MVYGVLLLGLLLISAGLKGNANKLGQQFANDMIGPQGFIVWAFAICGIGAVGYIPGFEKTTRYFLILLFVVLFLTNQGVFNEFQAAIQGVSQAGPAHGTAQPDAPATAASGSGSGAGGGGGALGGIASVIGPLASIGSFFGL
jgi:hypothetical protein